MLGCDFEGAICVNSDGVEVTGSCTKYYALCTEQHIQTAPIEVNNPETTSCRDGIIVAATNCVAPTTCTVLGIHCTDAQGTEVANSCTSYFRECENGVLTEVMPVARGSKCLNNAIVLNSLVLPIVLFLEFSALTELVSLSTLTARVISWSAMMELSASLRRFLKVLLAT